MDGLGLARVGGVVLIVVGVAFLVVALVPALAEQDFRRTRRVRSQLPRRSRWAAGLSRRGQRLYMAAAGGALTALGFYAFHSLATQ